MILSLFALLPLTVVSPADTPAANWPSFRGVNASGISEGSALPVKWDAEKKDNIAWKTPIPGLGHNCPVIWGDRIYVTSAVSEKPVDELKVGLYGDIAPVKDDTPQKFKIFCLNKKTGAILWERTAAATLPKVKRHTKSTHANPTIATDGKHILASFGSEGLYCYSPKGDLLWKKDLGVLDSGYYVVPSAQWGFASSPVIADDKVVLQCDIQKDSFLTALRIKDGSEIWRTARTEVPTWGTPLVVKEGGRNQVVVNGYKHIGGYDLNTGKELWKMAGGGDIPVPTPIAENGLIYITNAHGRMAPIYAVRATAEGDITLADAQNDNAGVAWCTRREGGYMQTPILYKGLLYVCRDNGILNCYDAKTGEKKYAQRLGTGRTGFTASAVAGDGKLYFSSEEGDIYVVKAGTEFEVLATNTMGEICMATPAISEGVIYYHTRGHLVAIKAAVKK